jgi:charged multivesicular body protein 4
MWSWFGGGAAQARKDAPKNAILSLRQQLDMLQKRERHLENQMSEQDAVARKNVATNKNGMPETFYRSAKQEESTLNWELW